MVIYKVTLTDGLEFLEYNIYYNNIVTNIPQLYDITTSGTTGPATNIPYATLILGVYVEVPDATSVINIVSTAPFCDNVFSECVRLECCATPTPTPTPSFTPTPTPTPTLEPPTNDCAVCTDEYYDTTYQECNGFSYPLIQRIVCCTYLNSTGGTKNAPTDVIIGQEGTVVGCGGSGTYSFSVTIPSGSTSGCTIYTAEETDICGDYGCVTTNVYWIDYVVPDYLCQTGVTPTPTPTVTITSTPTSTPTGTPTSTPTGTPTPTPTSTSTTPTPTPTGTPTPTPTSTSTTPTPTPSSTPTNTPTSTPTGTPTGTPTPTPTTPPACVTSVSFEVDTAGEVRYVDCCGLTIYVSFGIGPQVINDCIEYGSLFTTSASISFVSYGIESCVCPPTPTPTGTPTPTPTLTVTPSPTPECAQLNWSFTETNGAQGVFELYVNSILVESRSSNDSGSYTVCLNDTINVEVFCDVCVSSPSVYSNAYTISDKFVLTDAACTQNGSASMITSNYTVVLGDLGTTFSLAAHAQCASGCI